MKGLSLKTKGNYYPIENYKNIESNHRLTLDITRITDNLLSWKK